MTLNLIALSLPFGIFVILKEISLCMREKKISIKNLFFVLYGVLHGIVPFLIGILKNTDILSKSQIDLSEDGMKYLFIYLLLSIVGYFFLLLGYHIVFFIRKDSRSKETAVREADAKEDPAQTIKNKQPDSVKIDDFSDCKGLELTLILSLVFGSIALYLWTRGYGGLSIMMANTEAIRTGVLDSVSMGYSKHFCWILQLSTYLSVFLIKRKYHRAVNSVILIISFVLSLLFNLLKDGRMSAAMFFVTLLFIWIGIFEDEVGQFKHKLRIISVLFILFIVFVLYMNSIAVFLRTGTVAEGRNDGFLVSVFRELGFVYYGGQTALRKIAFEGCPYLLWDDIRYAVFSWVPSRFKPSDLVDVWEYNTQEVARYFSVSGQQPTGLIVTSLYDLGYFGVTVIPFFWGVVVGIVEKKRRKNTLFSALVYYSLMYILLRTIMYCSLHVSLILGLSILIVYGFYIVAKRISFKRR